MEGNKEDEGTKWTVAKSVTKNRGKEQIPNDTGINCNNGFEALLLGESSTTFENKVP